MKLKRVRFVAVPNIITINILIYFLWYLAMATDPTFMMQNFLVSWSGLVEGRFWTLITSVFSHNMFLHVFINMYVLLGFGTIIESTLGTRKFISFYLVAGLFSSLTHALTCAFLLNKPDLPALGASGSIAGVILVFSLMFPKEKILIFGIIPFPALWAAVFLIALDIWGLSTQIQGHGLPIGHGAHLGGAATGLIYYFFVFRNIKT